MGEYHHHIDQQHQAGTQLRGARSDPPKCRGSGAWERHTVLNIKWEDDNTSRHEFAVFLHFADFQDSQVREFNVYFNSGPPNKYRPHYLVAGFVYTTRWYRAIDGDFNVTLAATPESVLPPMLNAYEIYTLIVHDTPTTFQQDGMQTTTLPKRNTTLLIS